MCIHGRLHKHHLKAVTLNKTAASERVFAKITERIFPGWYLGALSNEATSSFKGTGGRSLKQDLQIGALESYQMRLL